MADARRPDHSHPPTSLSAREFYRLTEAEVREALTAWLAAKGTRLTGPVWLSATDTRSRHREPHFLTLTHEGVAIHKREPVNAEAEARGIVRRVFGGRTMDANQRALLEDVRDGKFPAGGVRQSAKVMFLEADGLVELDRKAGGWWSPGVWRITPAGLAALGEGE